MARCIRLALHPVLTPRVPPPGSDVLTPGFELRIAGGPAIEADDPLLVALGVTLLAVRSYEIADHVADDERFGPGRPVTLVAADDDEGMPSVGVWDAEGHVRLGVSSPEDAAPVRAALDVGLDLVTVVLTELRSVVERRRVGVELAVAPRGVVRLPPRRRAPRTDEGSGRSRLVLIVDRPGGDLRWWDADTAQGPLPVDAVPVSEELASELRALRLRWRELGERMAGGPLERWDIDFEHSEVVEETRRLWLRARRDLGRRYRVGLLEPGMDAPRWGPGGESEGDGDTVF